MVISRIASPSRIVTASAESKPQIGPWPRLLDGLLEKLRKPSVKHATLLMRPSAWATSEPRWLGTMRPFSAFRLWRNSTWPQTMQHNLCGSPRSFTHHGLKPRRWRFALISIVFAAVGLMHVLILNNPFR